MKESIIYRIITIEVFVIVLAELICTKHNWEQTFNAILIALLAVSFALFGVWYHKKDKR